MQEHEKGFAALILIGAAIGLAKLLVSEEKITTRLAVGRAILGGMTSTVAGVALMQFPNMPPLALLGAGAGIGILGAQYLEAWLKKQADKIGR
ncbi:hypothetical protein ACPRNU_10025 [Chromobacterium vaccinii]|uniref:hypothetical protein n=1 Tax=Chromobacterium vaccinii TaxID=1108595 RepID=UPI003C785012